MVRHTSDTGRTRRPGQAGKAEKGAERADKGAARKPAPIRGERVAKALARAGVASRREVERLIGLGKIAVNGRLIDTPATFIRPGDILTVDGEVVDKAEATRVWRYHKPAGLVTSHRDPEGRPTVFENLPKGLPRVISVGRLDLNSEGLLLLTNDGELSRALELPATGVRRVYRARAHGRITQNELDRLKDGIEVDGVRYGSIDAKLDKAKEKEGGANLWITVSLNEGKNREVRRVLEAIGLKVNRLIRLAYGPFQLGTLGVGEVEEVGPRVIREQLAEHVAPESLPKGDRVLTPAPQPSRRPIPTSGLANPRAKPSRVREEVARREERDAERAARPRAPRPERREDDRPYRPRREGDERPRGDRPNRPRREGDERPQGDRPYRPRREGDERPRGDRPYKPREERGGEGGKRPYKPREERGEGGKRPYKPRGERVEGERSPKPWAERGERPKREGDERPRGDRPYKPREPRGGEGAERGRPQGKRPGWAKPRPEGDRAERAGGQRAYKPRDGDRPERAGEGKRPFKPRGEGGDRPYKPRGEGGGKRPSGGKPGGPRGAGPRGPRKPRPA